MIPSSLGPKSPAISPSVYSLAETSFMARRNATKQAGSVSPSVPSRSKMIPWSLMPRLGEGVWRSRCAGRRRNRAGEVGRGGDRGGGDLGEEREIQGVQRVAGLVIVGIPEEGRIRDHDGGEPDIPERSVFAQANDW